VDLRRVLRFDTPTARLRALAFVEGCSYLLLLFVAMPLKYVAGQPMAVRLAGSVHGGLFIALALAAWQVMRVRKKAITWGVRVGVLSVIPFGTFFLDRELGQDDEAFRCGA
jgi:integral membrane protein